MIDFFFALWETVGKLGGRNHVQETHSRGTGVFLPNNVRHHFHGMRQATCSEIAPGLKGFCAIF